MTDSGTVAGERLRPGSRASLLLVPAIPIPEFPIRLKARAVTILPDFTTLCGPTCLYIGPTMLEVDQNMGLATHPPRCGLSILDGNPQWPFSLHR